MLSLTVNNYAIRWWHH